MNLFFLTIGLLGICSSSFLLPLIARAAQKKATNIPLTDSAQNPTAKTTGFDVCIPAHNEQDVIGESLRSIRQAGTQLLEKAKTPHRFQILLGCDGCTDSTAKIGKEFSDLVFNYQPSQGKWQTLNSLAKECHTEWLIFADAGAIWPADFFSTELLEQLQDPKVMGVSLVYQPSQTSRLEKLYWKIEASIKKNEQAVGGPISVSGFTCIYKQSFLNQALKELKEQFPEQNWLNDDVILPLWMRSRFPERKIIIWDLKKPINDLGISADSGSFQIEWRRRKRLVRGNLQWIRKAWPTLKTKASWPLRLLVWRRILKVFWAVWLSFFLFGLVPCLAIGILILLLTLAPLHSGARKFIAAFAASWLAAFELLFARSGNDLWK
jgi:glycosyltransferase involved in cell wall biosynthesis